MLRTFNRVLLALAGLVLVALGGPVLVIGLGVKPPGWWIHQGEHDVLLTHHERTRWQGSNWWWPTVIAALALGLVLALWWLASVLRRHRLAEVLVDTGDGEEALLRGRAMEAVLAAEAAAVNGVEEADVTLSGRRNEPHTRIRLLLAPQAAPGDTLHRLTTGPLNLARQSAGLPRLPATVHMRPMRHRAQRVL
ncbi:alkaline shock response membrane anchor protein AmaP [Streptomyces sp. TS71-3]|uniref:alkaline shock response membrane anchor protein AmaP n=1 Tax=Streptomyces sp. TS71-3 TaxID=2733862 RepID=UPI001B2CBB7F|nr:alkaline shock response membrane anchor protein AmaP [Streptomyces sp. TS71-3]GHJ38462.1 hypothetical protein Sm713_40710 [Streptomyces sp. TS71-3]